jgi:hypothetical protein
MRFRASALLILFLLAGCKSKVAKPAAPKNLTVTVQLAHCANMPPICKDGLLSQHATAAEINAYQKNHDTTGCRFMQPPRCPTTPNFKRACIEECTP